MSPEIGRILLVIGLVLVVVGGLAALGVRLPFGRLPGSTRPAWRRTSRSPASDTAPKPSAGAPARAI
jgi:hypothetical protein